MRYNYIFKGSVFINDKFVMGNFKTKIEAETEKEAYRKIKDQIIKECKIEQRVRIRLIGELKVLETIL